MGIARVRTSIAAFVGWVPHGPGTPLLVYNTAEAAAVFGQHPLSVVTTALEPFFTCGGREAWVVPLATGGEPLVADAADYGAAWAAGAPVWAALDACASLGLLAAPGASHVDVLAPLLEYAVRRRGFLLVDAPPGASAATLTSGVPAALRGDAGAHAAIYAPWVHMGLATGAVPPSGAVAGVLARVEEANGVWTAAAGTDVPLLGATGVAQTFTRAERDALNAAGINTIAQFPNLPAPVVWGGRTLANGSRPGPEWKYVNVRRFLLFLERSVDEGTRWAVSEPNEAPAWARVRQEVNELLFGLFRDGALLGRTPREAYYVRCDRATMTQDDIDQGRLVCEIGVAPVKPAEFVVFRIGQWTASRPA
jgi:phage tail sheath protein FI